MNPIMRRLLRSAMAVLSVAAASSIVPAVTLWRSLSELEEWANVISALAWTLIGALPGIFMRVVAAAALSLSGSGTCHAVALVRECPLTF
jgi:hypothetical protein